MISMRVINLKSISNKLNSQMEDDEELSESESDYDSVRTGDMSNEDEMIEEEAFWCNIYCDWGNCILQTDKQLIKVM